MENFKSKLSKITVFIAFIVLFNLLLDDKAISQTLKAITEDDREEGVLIMPLGNVIVIMPPLNINIENLNRLMEYSKKGYNCSNK